ncbi:MarR family winged helix-turn-helix transcriptional regulator [Leptospira sp. WS39.C2]
MRIATEQGFDLFPEQWFVLVKIIKQPGCSQSDLSRDFDDRPSMTRALRNMEQKAWIKIIPDTEDRRKHKVYPTKKGNEIYKVIVPVIQKERTRMFKSLTKEDFSKFKRIIDQIYEQSIV